MRIGLFVVAVCVAACSALTVTNKVRYDNYKVFRIIPDTADELQLLKNVEKHWELLDFWQRPSKVGRAVDIMVSPEQELGLLNSLNRPGLHIETWFVEGYNGGDTVVKSMLDNFVWIIVPVYNIDGYKYTWTNERMWRKNRNTNGGAVCKGVDLNRNFDYQWGGAGQTACAETYQGDHALSEPENSGLKSFLLDRDVILFIDFHSYGQYWLYPWGYTGEDIAHKDKADQRSVALKIQESIRAEKGKSYFVGESGPDMYPATGGSEDFGYGSLGVKFSYVVELRDNGRYGFVLPESQIQDQATEIFAGMKTLGQELNLQYGN